MNATSADERVESLRKNAGWVIVLGVIILLLGIFAITCPLITGVATALLIGGVVLIEGILQLAHALKAKGWGAGLLRSLGGLLSIACGVLVLLHPLAGLGFLTLLLAVFFLVEGLMRVGFSFRLRPLRGWCWTLFGGLVSILLGVLIWVRWPLSGTWAVGTLIGIHFFFVGFSTAALGIAVRCAAPEAQAPGETPTGA